MRDPLQSGYPNFCSDRRRSSRSTSASAYDRRVSAAPHATLEDLRHNVRVTGVHPDGPVTVVRAEWHGSQAVTLTYRTDTGSVQERMLFRGDEPGLAVLAPAQRRWSFRGDGRLFRLAAEARRIRLAHLFDPFLAASWPEIHRHSTQAPPPSPPIATQLFNP